MKPIIKTNRDRHPISDWIVERFPEEYRGMTYLEPFVGSGAVLLAKEPSTEEVLNDHDCGVVSVWRAVRDEPSEFAARLRRMKYSESSFRRHQTAREHDDYVSAAVCEFSLRQMSKNGAKASFVPRGESKCGECWKGLLDSVGKVHERIKSAFFLCRDHEELLAAFNKDSTFVYCDPPPVDEEFMSSDKHVRLGDILKGYRGKVMVVGPPGSLYRRMLQEWTRRSLPGGSGESVWTNF